MELITKSNRKDDRHDARTRKARIDPELLGPGAASQCASANHLTVIRRGPNWCELERHW
jgi:hypothetical protein